jgi:pimeloyl-ACP methyl ester carboxylesterase
MSNPVAGVLRSRTGELIPGGAEPGDELLATRVHDVDAAISYLAGGGDAVLDSIDGNRVAVLGHSYGGATAAQVAAINPAVRAVGVLDATVLGTVAAEGLDVPTLLLTAGDLDPTRERFWDLLTGPRTGWQLNRAGHFTFTDLATLIPALGPADSLSTFGIGTDPNSTSTAVRELARSFLDQHLDSDTDVSDQFRPIS